MSSGTPTVPQGSEVIDGITVVWICALLDALFPQGWAGADPEVTNSAVLAWVKDSGAHYHAWEGESYLRLTELDRGLAAAKRAGKSLLLIEPLS